jgi:hypothetical protein
VKSNSREQTRKVASNEINVTNIITVGYESREQNQSRYHDVNLEHFQ